MKNIFPLLFLAILSFQAKATLTFTLTTAPCNNDGVLTVNISGLTPPYTVQWYTWGTGRTLITHAGITGSSDALTSYSGGPINVTVTDAAGASDFDYYIGAPPFSYTISATSAVCPALGTVSATPTGGTGPFTYQWYTIPGSTIASTSNPALLPVGAYGVRITDAAGCVYGSESYDDSATLYPITTFSFTPTSTNANCTNGTATTGAISGSSGPFSYLWSNGATSSSVSGLVKGYYNVKVTDGSGCSNTQYVFVNQTITISAPITATPASCTLSDGAAAVFPTGGLPPYSYVWSNSVTLQSQSGMPAGNYHVTATDANGCSGEGWTTIGTATPITVTYSATSSSCTSPTGTATAVATGGTGPYTITWYTTPVQTTFTATSLAPGTYGFKVTDAAGCTRTGAVVVPPVSTILASFVATPTLCTLATGSLTVFASGGTSPYTYSWTGGGTASSITGRSSGYHSVTITDAIGCKLTRGQYIPYSSPVSVGLTSTAASCRFTADGSLTAIVTGGTGPYTYSWGGGGTTSTVTGRLPGRYYVIVTDAAGCIADNFANVGIGSGTSCYCTITGTVYHDVNNNCIQDAGEPGIPNIQMECSGQGYTYTDATGHYTFLVPTGSYTISETIRSMYPLSTCQSNHIPVSVVAASGCVNTINFGNAINPLHDIHISTWNRSFPIPGNIFYQDMIISNEGTVSESAILTGYKPDGQLLSPTFAPGAIFSGSAYWYNTAAGFPTLAPGTSQAFMNTYNVPTSIPLGTSVVFKDTSAYMAPMSNWLTDYSPANNVNYTGTTIVASYDPNFKEVLPKGIGPTGIINYSDSILEYRVHFQNEGTWFAQNVVVIDTLDNNLDWTSLHPIFQSAKCKITLNQAGSYKIATFTFNNINLPPRSSSEVESNGMFTYTIKTKPGLPLGTTFRNSASIYFDYNAPVKTNTTLNTLGSTTATTNTVPDEHHSFLLYPNPAGVTFNAVINSDIATEATLLISDITGKTIINKPVTLLAGAQTISTDASQLTPGIYLVTLSRNGKTETSKLVIMK